MSEDLPSRVFEKLAAAVQCYLDPGAIVTHDLHVKGVKSGERRQIDVAVQGSVGSKSVLVVVECRHYARPIDVGKIDGFVGFLEDVQANAGIMVTTVGYSQAALQRADSEGIETWVLRPANDDDWQGYLRSVESVVKVCGVQYYECRAELADGGSVNISPMTMFTQPSKDPPFVFFSHVMNSARQQHGYAEGEVLRVVVGEPLFLGGTVDDSKAVKYLSAISKTEELFEHRGSCSAAQDWVFRRYKPGAVDSDCTFLEIARLRTLVENVRSGT